MRDLDVEEVDAPRDRLVLDQGHVAPEFVPTDRSVPSEISSLKITDATKHKIFLWVAENGRNLALIARAMGLSRNALQEHLKKDPWFAENIELAQAHFTNELAREARRRALQGVLKPIYNKDGDKVGYERVYSDNLMMFLLKANDPDMYREQIKVDAKVSGGVLVVNQQVPVTDAKQRLEDLTRRQEQLMLESEPGVAERSSQG